MFCQIVDVDSYRQCTKSPRYDLCVNSFKWCRKKLESIDDDYSDGSESTFVQTVHGSGLDVVNRFFTAAPRPPSSSDADDSILHRNRRSSVTTTGGGGSVLGDGFPSTAGFVTCSISDLINLDQPPSPVHRQLLPTETTTTSSSSSSSSSSRSRSHDAPGSNISFVIASSLSDREHVAVDNDLDSTTYF